jgi:hypothetical protein
LVELVAVGWSVGRGGNVAALARKPGLVELFGRGMDGGVWQNYWHADAGDWSGWFPIEDPGVLTGDPAVVSMSPDHLQLFAPGADDQLWSKWWTDG